MRIGLTYNLKPEHPPEPGEPIDRYEEYDSEETVEAIAAALRRLGHHVERLGWGPTMLDALIQRAEGDRLDGVFNFAEGVGGRGRESQVPAMLEMLGIPNTGSDPVALALALDKGLAKIFAAGHGLATAPFCIVGADEVLHDPGLRYPLFAKPVAEGSSMGIRNTSVCRGFDELRELVGQLQADYRQPVLVEEFLPGDEFTVGVLGNGDAAEVLGVMQVVPVVGGGDFVYSLEVKRDYQNQVVYRYTPELRRTGAVSETKLAAVRKLALDAHRAFGCRDVSRVDIRCDRDDVPNFIEINPLPGLNPLHSDLVLMARGHGWTFDQLIGRIIDAASGRWEPRAATGQCERA
jgi:D-alanine-D-alanine ligase